MLHFLSLSAVWCRAVVCGGFIRALSLKAASRCWKRGPWEQWNSNKTLKAQVRKPKKKNYLKARILEPTGAAVSIASYVITINDPYNNTWRVIILTIVRKKMCRWKGEMEVGEFATLLSLAAVLLSVRATLVEKAEFSAAFLLHQLSKWC